MGQQKMKDLDKTDRKMILGLFSDGRISVNGLAKIANISNEVATYRLKRLQKNGTIKKITPLIDLSPIGINTYRIQLRFRQISKERYASFMEYCRNIQQLSWLVCLSGPWDIVLLFWIRSAPEFMGIYNDLMFRFGDIIQDKLFTIVTSIEQYPPTYIFHSGRKPVWLLQQNLMAEGLEDNQKLILRELQIDGRRALTDIAGNLGVSVTTVKYHMRLLKEQNILLGFRPVLDTEKLGYEHFKVTLVLNDTSRKSMLRELLSCCDNVVYITESIGRYDLEFVAEFMTMRELLRYIENIKQAIGIREYEVIFSNKEIIINQMLQ